MEVAVASRCWPEADTRIGRICMIFDWTAVGAGLGVGTIVGLTGVGGGSLMTPLLISVFGLDKAVAIGTDLWFAGLTKVSGSVAHHREGHVDYHIVKKLLLGSIPASIGTLVLMHFAGIHKSGQSTLAFALGIDGGAVSPVPVRFARQMGAELIIAVDISAIPEGQPTKGAVDILLQTFNIMGHAISQYELADAEVVVRPKLQGVGSADFSARRLSILAGREAMLTVLPQLRERLAARTR